MLLCKGGFAGPASKAKLVLMSATVEEGDFKGYFPNLTVVRVPGRTFEVKRFYLEDAIRHVNYVYQRGDGGGRRSGCLPDDPKDDGIAAEIGEVSALIADAKGTQVKENLEGRMRQLEAKLEASEPADLLTKLLQPMTLGETVEKFGFPNPALARSLRSLAPLSVYTQLIALLISAHASNNARTFGLSGDVLVFLPGVSEISALQAYLTSSETKAAGHLVVLPLHSNLTTGEQHRVFETVEGGTTKVILATNIAEAR
jgi:HrpA-like RNA helicase